MMNLRRLGTAEAISDEIEEYCEDIEEISREATETFRFSALVVGSDEKGAQVVLSVRVNIVTARLYNVFVWFLS